MQLTAHVLSVDIVMRLRRHLETIIKQLLANLLLLGVAKCIVLEHVVRLSSDKIGRRTWKQTLVSKTKIVVVERLTELCRKVLASEALLR